MMSPKEKMILIVGEAIIKGLHKHANKQTNLSSSGARHVIASDILDEILIVIDNPEFKNAQQECKKS
jgi:ABC-type Fe3+ transport system substrate-binding protein